MPCVKGIQTIEHSETRTTRGERIIESRDSKSRTEDPDQHLIWKTWFSNVACHHDTYLCGSYHWTWFANKIWLKQTSYFTIGSPWNSDSLWVHFLEFAMQKRNSCDLPVGMGFYYGMNVLSPGIVRSQVRSMCISDCLFTHRQFGNNNNAHCKQDACNTTFVVNL